MLRAKRSLGSLLLLALSGCATQLAAVDGPAGRAELLRTAGTLSVRIDDGAAVSLNGLTDARLLGILAVGGERVAIVAGTAEGCRQAQLLVIAPRTGDPRALSLPDCDTTFTFAAAGAQLLATHVGANGARQTWRYADGALTGPLTSSATIARRVSRPRGAAPEASAGQAPAETQPEIPVETVPAPLTVPRVSRTVGNDVIPTEVRTGRYPDAPVVDLR